MFLKLSVRYQETIYHRVVILSPGSSLRLTDRLILREVCLSVADGLIRIRQLRTFPADLHQFPFSRRKQNPIITMIHKTFDSTTSLYLDDGS